MENREDVEKQEHEPEDLTSIVDRVKESPAPDAADQMAELSEELEIAVIQELPTETAAGVISEMHPEEAADVLEDIAENKAADILEAMAPDDAADVVEELEPEVRQSILEEMEPEPTEKVKELLEYPQDTAGGIMTPEATFLTEDYAVEQAINELRRLKQEAETLYYVYVVDAQRHLIGVLSMRDLILARPETRLSDILIRDVRSVNARLDREEVARLISRYDYLALPVVDDEDRLLGIVTVDDVIDVIQEEATEDIQRMVGASGDERVDSPWLYSLRKRLPWLEVNLGTAFLAAAVVGIFEGTIARITALAVFLPVVAGQGGNTGAQALAVVIRALALGEVSGRAAWQVLRRELLLGLASGIVVGLTTSAIAYLWVRSPMIGIVIGSAMVINMTLATISGAAIPLGLRALRLDPAQSSSIILTTVTDVVGFGAFLGLATLLLK